MLFSDGTDCTLSDWGMFDNMYLPENSTVVPKDSTFKVDVHEYCIGECAKYLYFN